MTIYPQAILGMIEIDKANDTLEIVTSVGTYDLVPSYYTYANVIDLLFDLNSKLGANGDMYLSKTGVSGMTSDFKPVIELATGTMTSITSGTIKDILFAAFVPSAGKAIALYTPLNCWIPEYRSKDGNWFEVESGSVLKGSVGVSGNLSGIAYTTRQKREIEWDYITKDNTFTGVGTSTVNKRSFENVINNARANSLTYAGSDNIYCKGVYYIHSIVDYIGSASELSNTWTDGSPNSQTYVFCTADPPNIAGQSDSNMNTYYNVTLGLTTGTAPEWDN